jgi:hypothetical protein
MFCLCLLFFQNQNEGDEDEDEDEEGCLLSAIQLKLPVWIAARW